MTILQHGIAQAAGGGGYQIARSLRFNSADTAYLNRTPGTAGNRKTFTISIWFKRSSFGVLSKLISAGTASGAFTSLEIPTDNTFKFLHYDGSSITWYIQTTQVFRDPSGWAHLLISVDTTQATSSNRLKMYINGSQITALTSSYPTQNTDSSFNAALAHQIGNGVYNSTEPFSGYMADIRLIDGQQLDPTSFGEFDANTGVWMPKTYSGTYGTNGFWLKLDDNSGVTATTLGKDSSGNSNNWTPNNFSVTAGAGNDSLVDSPTNYGTDTGAGGEVRGNYCTLNPLDKGSDWTAVTNGNLDGTVQGPNGHSIRSTLAVSSGKWYWEFTNVNNLSCGIIKSELKIVPSSGSLWPGSDGFGVGGSFAYRPDNGNKTTNSTGTAYGATFTTTDVIGCALDMDNGKIYWSKNGVWQASGDPAAGTNAAYTGISGTFSPAWGYIGAGAGTLTVNFGQRPFAYTAPSGFKALCTQNLPTPAIGATSSTLASKNFDATLYTGNGSTQSITNASSFQPDFVWIKKRNAADGNDFFDAVRGTGKLLQSNSTSAESGNTGDLLSAFNSDGFTVNTTYAGGTNGSTNNNGDTYVGWQWKGGGTAVTNTAGTISSQVSANPTAGISVVTYTGNGTSGATVGHGIGSAVQFIIVKQRGTGGGGDGNWLVGATAAIGWTGRLILNGTQANEVNSSHWNNTAPTSSVFTLGNAGNVNGNTGNYVAYCFAEVAGFSKFGSYTGNGSADGAFIYLGFRPAFFVVKMTSAAGENWTVHDAKRNTYNLVNNKLYPSASAGEAADSNNTCDFLSNGIKLRDGYNGWNASGATYLYMAFAEAPFNYSRAR